MMCACDEDGQFDLDLVEPIPGLRYVVGEDREDQRRKDEEVVARIRARKAEIAAARRVPCRCDAVEGSGFPRAGAAARERDAS